MKKFLTPRVILSAISVIFAFLGGCFCGTDGGAGMLHNFWIMPLCGILIAATDQLPLLLYTLISFVLGLQLANLISGGDLYLTVMLLLTAAAGLFCFLGMGLGHSARKLFSPNHRGFWKKFSALSVLIVLTALLFFPINAAFGNPFSAYLAKQQLDGCMAEHADTARYTVENFGSD